MQSQSSKRQCGCHNVNAGKIWIDDRMVEMAPACPHRDSASHPGATRQNQNTCAADDGGITRSKVLLNTSAPQPLRASNETFAVDTHQPTRKRKKKTTRKPVQAEATAAALKTTCNSGAEERRYSPKKSRALNPSPASAGSACEGVLGRAVEERAVPVA